MENSIPVFQYHCHMGIRKCCLVNHSVTVHMRAVYSSSTGSGIWNLESAVGYFAGPGTRVQLATEGRLISSCTYVTT